MKQTIELILGGFLNSPQKIDTSNPVHRALIYDLSGEISAFLNNQYSVKGSAGVGNRADVPWASIIDNRVADGTQKGLYIVYLFKEDMSGFYLALANGITYFRNQYKSKANQELNNFTSYLLNQIPDKSFSSEKPALGSGDKAKGYSASTVISKYYDGSNVPDDVDLQYDLQKMVSIYKSLSDSISNIGYDAVVDKVINGYSGDLSTMTGVSVKTKMFTWDSFYKELSDKLLSYKNNRDDLVKTINEIYTELGERNPLFAKSYNDSAIDVDPFTVVAMINRGIKETKKVKVCEAFKKHFQMSSDVPSDFVGLPTRDNRKLWYFTWSAGSKTGDLHDIDNLWDFFEASLKYAKDSSTNADFEKLFDLVIKQKLVSWTLTSALFWIRSDTYMTFDDNSKKYIVDSGLATKAEVDGIINSGKQYLELCAKLKTSLSSLGFKNFRELSAKAWAGKSNITEDDKMVGYNKIYYGMPGCGKSYKVETEILKGVSEENCFRVIFHQDYSYSDFMGQIMPKTSLITNSEGKTEKILSYDFVPGPFVAAIERAYNNPTDMVYLIIEEINRGNAPSIFGDAFQLLDRVNEPESPLFGQSRYPINNEIVMQYLNKSGKLYIPENLTIIATMNTSDQNVFTLDAAFKRRWQLEEVRNDWSTHPYPNYFVPGTKIGWRSFVESVNKRIVSMKTNMGGTEDKRLGAYFVQQTDLLEKSLPLTDPKCQEVAKRFAYKVLEYLWDDVCRFNKTDLFDSNYNTLSDLIDAFIIDGIDIFIDGVFE